VNLTRCQVPVDRWHRAFREVLDRSGLAVFLRDGLNPKI
jgi:hypothetical protein